MLAGDTRKLQLRINSAPFPGRVSPFLARNWQGLTRPGKGAFLAQDWQALTDTHAQAVAGHPRGRCPVEKHDLLSRNQLQLIIA